MYVLFFMAIYSGHRRWWIQLFPHTNETGLDNHHRIFFQRDVRGCARTRPQFFCFISASLDFGLIHRLYAGSFNAYESIAGYDCNRVLNEQ